ncbi:MAG TPA: hypothetical protein PKZ76_11695 [Xanthomonadaceae bacterium]|nr:hypothetical protein [Xanthomonadaceae bacterium]
MTRLSALMLVTLLTLPAWAGAQSIAALPGHYFHHMGELAYKREDYRNARTLFERSAHWGDKLSQFNLGVIHYQGQGVPVNKPMAWAWFAVSAERRYARMEKTASMVWQELDAAGRAEAERLYEDLLARYGDAVAVPRAERRMERERRNVTGSRTGMVGNLVVIDPGTGQSWDGTRFYDPKFFDFAGLMEREAILMDAIDRGRVELRELELKDDD